MCIACSPLGSLLSPGAGSASRRLFLRGAGAASFAAGFGGAGGLVCEKAFAQASGVDTIYSGGPILTMDDTRPTAEAVLTRNGRIMAVGSRAEVAARAAAGARRVELDGRTMLPGFFDPHAHLVGVGLQSLSANLLPPPDGPGKDIPALQATLRAWMAANTRTIERYGLVLGFGYDDSQLAEQRHPTRDELDAVSADVPVVLVHQSSHLGVANSPALAAAGVTAETPDPEGGVFVRRDGSREPNGVCEEYAFFRLIGPLIGKLDEAAFLAMLRGGTAFCASHGYTTMQEARATTSTAALLTKAAAAGLLPIDVLVYPDLLDATEAITPSRTYRNRLRVGGAKLTIDGSPQGKTAFLSQPYFQPPAGRNAEYRGYAVITQAQTSEAVDRAYANNWQLLTHANGDAAIDMLIEAVRAAQSRHGGGDRRPVLIHGQTCRLDQLASLKQAGIIPSFFPMHTFYWGDWHRHSVLGPERAERISPCASAVKAGMIFTSHHDAPVANPDSMRVLSATVTRTTRSGYVLGPEERVSPAVALKAMTLWAARQHFEEATKGSIARGKLADFVLLDDNPMTVAAERLAGLKVIETIKEGQTIYRA